MRTPRECQLPGTWLNRPASGVDGERSRPGGRPGARTAAAVPPPSLPVSVSVSVCVSLRPAFTADGGPASAVEAASAGRHAHDAVEEPLRRCSTRPRRAAPASGRGLRHPTPPPSSSYILPSPLPPLTVSAPPRPQQRTLASARARACTRKRAHAPTTPRPAAPVPPLRTIDSDG